MCTKQYALELIKILHKLVPDPAIPLTYSDPYTLLIAALLSAQCTDDRVNSVTQVLFLHAPTPEDMVALGVRSIEQIIQSLGLYKTKAKHIWALSKILVDRFHGQVPSTFEELESLPGVGHKTASVVMAHAFHIPAFPVDTHILRSAQRWHLSTHTTPEGVEKDLKALFPKKSWGSIHLLIILAARRFCKARPHNTSTCPICSRLPGI